MQEKDPNKERIVFQTKQYEDHNIFKIFNPLILDWWMSSFSEFSPPQKFAIVNIHNRENTLVSSPTGSGKTLSAFTAILNELTSQSIQNQLEDKIYCVYISPLKALGNDIQKNLNSPLCAIQKIYDEKLEAMKYKKNKEHNYEPTDKLIKIEKKEKIKKLTNNLNIRIGVRTGDTSASERSKMARKSPHILITTPESFAIMLTSPKFKENFKSVEWVIIDEVHALADSKRGTHLSLSLERLHSIKSFCRIGLSATVSPLEDIAKFLVGYEDPENKIFRPCKIIDVSYIKKMDLKVLSPVNNLITTPYKETHIATYNLVNDLIQKHKTTLIFTNTRSATERVVHNLKDKFPTNYAQVDETNDPLTEDELEKIEEMEKKLLDREKKEKKEEDEQKQELIEYKKNHPELQLKKTKAVLKKELELAKELEENELKYKQELKNEKANNTLNAQSYIGAHHGSLSQELRLNIENRLKDGKLKAVVSSTSLELGIDIGYIDLVILLGSPKSVARALQRIGRSGHKLHDVSKGRIIALDRDDLVECSVLLKAATEKKIDKIHIPMNVFDVLAQQIFGIAIEDKQNIDQIYDLIRHSYPYGDLLRKDYNDILKYLAGEYANLEDRHVYAKIWIDWETKEMGKKGKMARVMYMTNVGTIPDETNVKVKIGAEYLGSIAEPFLERLKRGDVFVLGGQTYEFQYAQGMTAFVKTSVNRPPTVPSWFSEMLPLSFDLAMEVQKFRRYMEEQFSSKTTPEDILKFIHEYLYVDEYGANSIYEYFKEQFEYAEIPHDKKLVIEYFDDPKNKYIIFHSLYGRRTNDVLSRALAFVLSKIHNKDIEININDNGFYLIAPKGQSVQVSRAFGMLKANLLREVMKHALEKTEILNRRFRHCAGRSLMILRNYKGRSRSVGRQQASSRLLISAIKRIDNDFVILREARREVLEDLMDIVHAEEVITDIQSGKISIKEIHTEIPTPFAFNLISMGYSDIMKLEDKQQFLKHMHEMVLAKISLKNRRKIEE
ncbi:MAG: DEAD/DEAH box helicase [Candidatus Woesearchaeota archaeon]